MASTTDEIMLRFPKDAVGGMLRLSATLTDRMHALLERNTDGSLNATEKSELETLVEMAHFGEMLSMSLQAKVAS